MNERSSRLCCVAAAIALAGCGISPRQTKPEDLTHVLKILEFFPSASLVRRGEAVTICYGVENARAVKLDPPVAASEPSRHNCFAATITDTTEFKLTATGLDGVEVVSSFIVTARP